MATADELSKERSISLTEPYHIEGLPKSKEHRDDRKVSADTTAGDAAHKSGRESFYGIQIYFPDWYLSFYSTEPDSAVHILIAMDDAPDFPLPVQINDSPMSLAIPAQVPSPIKVSTNDTESDPAHIRDSPSGLSKSSSSASIGRTAGAPRLQVAAAEATTGENDRSIPVPRPARRQSDSMLYAQQKEGDIVASPKEEKPDISHNEFHYPAGHRGAALMHTDSLPSDPGRILGSGGRSHGTCSRVSNPIIKQTTRSLRIQGIDETPLLRHIGTTIDIQDLVGSPPMATPCRTRAHVQLLRLGGMCGLFPKPLTMVYGLKSRDPVHRVVNVSRGLHRFLFIHLVPIQYPSPIVGTYGI